MRAWGAPVLRAHASKRRAAAFKRSMASSAESPWVSRRTLIVGLSAITSGVILYSLWARQRNYASSRHLDRLDTGPQLPRGGREVRLTDDDKRPFKGADKQAAKPQEESTFSDWSSIRDRIKEAVVPDWATELPNLLSKLHEELSGEPGSLSDEIWRDVHDSNVHPEVDRPASVRVSHDLCDEEKEYLRKRKRHIAKALASYLDLDEDVHPDDVPTIAMCGSGGGLRALVAGTSSYHSAQLAGLFDCITYTAGVSGSCWLQLLYHSSISDTKFDKLLQHLKNRLGIHIAFPPPVMEMLTSAPTNKFLLAGPYEKYRGVENAAFGLVDVYGLLLGARLLVPKGELGVDATNLKISNQQRFLEAGKHPLPIYTAVRHEVPAEETLDNSKSAEAIKEQAKREAWFQWFEMTPYEFFCEEIGAGIPTWSIGRNFENGKSVPRTDVGFLPEIRSSLWMGIFGSAFCATLYHYFKEIRPIVQGMTGFKAIDQIMHDKNEDLVKVHPIEPAAVPNYAFGLGDALPDTVPESINSNKTLELMDAGMSNNLPIYPLLRPGRDVDIIVAFDASADIRQENWLRIVDGYARQRGVKGWPLGTGWPDNEKAEPEDTGKGLQEADQTSPVEAKGKLAQADADQKQQQADREAAREEKEASSDKSETKSEKGERKKRHHNEKNTDTTDLDFCNIWIGTTEERSTAKEPPHSKLVEEDWELMQPNAGIAVIYFPFMPNPKVEGVDPQTTDFMSTWNFVYTPENIDQVVELAKANFEAGEDKTKRAVRAVYERKKKQRLEREKRENQ